MPQERKRTNALGAFVALRLEQLGMTRPQLAERTGIGRTTIHKMLTERPPDAMTPAQLRNLADVLGTTMDALVEMWESEVVELRKAPVDDRQAALSSFALAHSDLSAEELRAALAVAEAAVRVTRAAQDGQQRPRRRVVS